MRVALIDADIVAFRCAASCKGEDPPEIANLRADRLMRQTIENTQADAHLGFISGSRNYRYDLFPDYKANRRGAVDPIHRQSVKEFLILEWMCLVSDGIEADDAIGIEHTRFTRQGDVPIICSIDKDFKQLSGRFYDFVLDKHFEVGQDEAKRYFYKQLVLGDKSDNIPGYDGKARQKPTKLIQHYYDLIGLAETEWGMYNQAFDAFMEGGQTQDDLHLTAQLCYILRNEGEFWKPPEQE